MKTKIDACVNRDNTTRYIAFNMLSGYIDTQILNRGVAYKMINTQSFITMAVYYMKEKCKTDVRVTIRNEN